MLKERGEKLTLPKRLKQNSPNSESMDPEPTIAVDIDEVLARHSHALARYVNENYGTSHSQADYFSEHWALVWDTDEQETTRRSIDWHESGNYENLEPVSGAYEALQKLKQDYQLGLITVRSKSIVDATERWVDEHFPDTFTSLRFIHSWDEPDSDLPSKAEVCQDTGAEWLIDDSLKHTRLMAEMGKEALLFGDYAWNQSNEELPEGVTRVGNWQGVLDYFYAEDRK